MNEVRRRRKACCLTIAELAKQIGVTPGFICQVEKGKSNLSIHTAQKLARTFGCTIDDLLGEKKDHDGLTESPNEGDAQNG